jgi:hypothetical protein
MAGLHGWTLAIAMLAAPAGHEGVISGTIINPRTDEPIVNALVILQCTCLQGMRETVTDAAGQYAFTGLPAGTYTIQVLVGRADVSKVVTLPHASPKG